MDNSRDVHTSVESEREVKWATHEMFILCRECERRVDNSQDVHTSVESAREVKWTTHEMFIHL